MSELAASAALAPRSPITELIADERCGLAPALERVMLAPGAVLFRQGTPQDGLYVLDGEVQVCRQLPGQRELELARLVPGDVIGEISLLGGGNHSATVRALGPCTLHFLRRTAFEAYAIVGDRCALELRRRIVAIACARLRDAYRALQTSLDGTEVRRAGSRPRASQDEPLPEPMPPLRYLSRLALLGDLEPAFVSALLSRSRAVRIARGHVVQAEGAEPDVFYVVLSGAVEDFVSHDTSLRRVGFAGPGHACGAVGVLDGLPAPATSVARELTLLLAIGRHDLESVLDEPGPGGRALRAAIEAEVVNGLSTAERALSQLAAEAT
jgi:CRP-like cAMP-binding protein